MSIKKLENKRLKPKKAKGIKVLKGVVPIPDKVVSVKEMKAAIKQKSKHVVHTDYT